jgi:hypothetical protein
MAVAAVLISDADIEASDLSASRTEPTEVVAAVDDQTINAE